MADDDVVKAALWQFNEAVSLLREARQVFVPADSGIATEIDDGLPAIQAALEALAAGVAAGPQATPPLPGDDELTKLREHSAAHIARSRRGPPVGAAQRTRATALGAGLLMARLPIDDLRTAAHTGGSPAERRALAELHALFDQAKGDHPALAEARQKIVAEIDSLTASLKADGVDVDALLADIEADRVRVVAVPTDHEDQPDG